MGHQAMRPDLHRDINDRIEAMTCYGESKRQAKKDYSTADKIFSRNTEKGYRHQLHKFGDWMAEHCPEGRFTPFNQWKVYAIQYLREMKDSELYSVSSLKTMRSALAKILGCPGEDLGYVGTRHRKNNKRSRNATKTSEKTGKLIKNRSTYAGRFSEEKHPESVTFSKATGLRKSELKNLRGNQLLNNDGPAYFEAYPAVVRRYRELRNMPQKTIEEVPLKILVPSGDYLLIKGKGGRVRCAPVLAEGLTLVRELCKTAGKSKVWKALPSNFDAHSYRAMYAKTVYSMAERDLQHIIPDQEGSLKDIMKTKDSDEKHVALTRYYHKNVLSLLLDPDAKSKPVQRSEVYFCRAELKGKTFDKIAMSIASEALGHSRISVIASNYLV